MKWFCLLFAVGCAAHAEISGRIRLEDATFLEAQTKNVDRTEVSARLQVEARVPLNDDWRLRVEPNARFSTAQRVTDSFDGDMRDSYIEHKAAWANLQFGSFIKRWEGPDGVNPMNIATVWNRRDPLVYDGIGSFGTAVNGTVGERFSWDALYVPWQTPARLPGNHSPWWPRRTSQSIVLADTKLLFPEEAEYEVNRHDFRGYAMRDNWGARAQLHFESLDLSAAYFAGAAQDPVLQGIISGTLVQSSPTTIIQLSNPVVVQPIEYRRHTYAAGMNWTLGSWIVRLAGRYDQPWDGDLFLPGWSDLIVGQLEKTLAVGSQTVILSGGYSYEDGAYQNPGPISGNDPFRRALIAGARIPFNDDFVFNLKMLLDTHEMGRKTKISSSYVHASQEWKVSPHWLTEATVEWLQGSEDTLLGIWSHESRAFLAAQLQF